MSALSETAIKELRRFGWTLGPEFERRYMEDAWVFNLVNALEAVARERDEAIGRALRVRELEAGLQTIATGKLSGIDAWEIARALIESPLPEGQK
jgi:hypothetical protein